MTSPVMSLHRSFNMMKIMYILLLIVAAIFYPMYPDKLSFLLLATLLILPVLLLAELIITGCRIRCSLDKTRLTFFKDENGEIPLRITNRSIFPIPCVTVCLRVSFSDRSDMRCYRISVPVPAKSTETVSIGIESVHCGTAVICVEHIRIYDLIKLFSLRKYRRIRSTSAVIVPKINERHRESALELLCANTADQCCDEKILLNGYPDEVTDFREFRAGDRLSLMHYKLSARFDKDIVKVMSPCGSDRYLLAADLQDCTDPDSRDRLLERIMSCAYYLSCEEAEVYVFTEKNPSVEGIFTDHGFAAHYSEDSDYFPIAAALCTSHCPMPENTHGFITCNMGVSEKE